MRVDADEALLLREEEGLSYAQIAERLGVGKTTVMRALTRARDEAMRSGGPKPVQNPAARFPRLCLMCGGVLDDDVDETAMIDDFVEWAKQVPDE